MCFLQIEGLWKSCFTKSTGTIFPAAFAHLMSLWHVLVIPEIFQSISLLLYWLWLVILMLTIVTVLRHHNMPT